MSLTTFSLLAPRDLLVRPNGENKEFGGVNKSDPISAINATTSLFEIPEAKIFLKALQRKKVVIQRDIEKDAFYREALFHDNAKAADSRLVDSARPYLALLTKQALHCLPKTMPCGIRLLLFREMTSRLASAS
ncbi:hypothetical protein A7317_00755 [Pseudomonas fluorescens]|uniref:hypothetical protein n=1 Tax=Pseudomonas TaxID=286 RepID=UPI00083CD1F6|nr:MULTISPECIES: hypothetical protein [Pseudomonas]AOE65565.1 hypothetical protein A7317_00755 [Pseudomonas fluorescens]AOE71385.1 hypothetical protein A7319_00775 [Pseudomonas fluorescens]WEX16139.1 hypothetical protein P2T68_02070 [Pseudomonas sp. G11]